MRYSLVVSDVSVTREEDNVQDELMQQCNGVINVARWYFDSDENYPMSCVQVDFDSLENLNKVLDIGNLVIGGICRRISVLKEPQCYRCQKYGHKVYDCKKEPLNQKDLIDLFAQQKQRLTQVMNNIEVKLNEVIARR